MGSLTKATTGTFAQGGVNSTNIQNEAITNAKIASDAAIANSKLAITFPTISSLSITNGQPAVYDTETVDINGIDFTNGARVDFIHSTTNAVLNLPTVTFVSATQLRVTIPASTLTEGTDYKIRVSNPDGLAATSTGTVLYSETVSFSTSSGSLGSVGEGESASFSVSASSNSTIAYSVTSGSLPTGLSLNSSTGAITGTAPSVSADTVSTFTITATDAESQTASRSFSITVTNFVIANSLRFNGTADSCYLSRTPSSTTDRQKFTISFWVKRAKVITRENVLFASRPSAGTYFAVTFRNSGSGDPDRILFQDNTGMLLTFAPRYRDVSAWYHIVASFDTTQATASNRAKLYVNGTQITDLGSLTTYPSQNVNLNWNVNQVMSVGGTFDPTNQSPDIYLAEAHSIDGQALSPTDFGETDSTTNNWIPKKYTGTYGTNGFYLDFADSGNLGDDESGNTNDFTATNLAATDQTSDTPTNNFATLNPLARSNNTTFSEGNTQIYGDASANYSGSHGTIGVNSGKWYCEVKVIDATYPQIGALILNTSSVGDARGDGSGYGMYYYYENIYWQDNNSAIKVINTSQTVTNATVTGGSNSVSNYTTNDIIMMALDMDNGYIWFGKNGTWENSGNPASGTNAFNLPTNYADGNGMTFYGGNDASTLSFNFGNPSFSISSGNADQNGYGNFEYAPPSGYLALCTNNLPNVAIADPTQYFNTVLYSGNGTDDRSIAGVGFQPDFVWGKNRSAAGRHTLVDSTRGATQNLWSERTDAEGTEPNVLQAFESDGFQVGSDTRLNNNGDNYVAWNWKANAGSTSSNTDGSITSTVQANTTAGFSIVTYTGNGNASPQTVGHGLGKKCQTVILKTRSVSGESWRVYQDVVSASAGGNLFLNGTSALNTSDPARVTATSSSTFTLTGYTSTYNAVNQSGSTYVAYCFAEIEGYSKFGSYIGNNSTDGPFIYTAFKPSFLLIKGLTGYAWQNWRIVDSKRDPYNQTTYGLYPDLSNAEAAGEYRDFLSNGFKIRGTGGEFNGSGESYIYMAFAEAPFKSGTGATTIEGTAR